MAIGNFSLPISSGSEWQRPSDWLPMPTNITSANQTFVALHAVFESGQNYCAFLFTTSAGQYQVDWGDGTTTLHNSNTVAQKDYNYASISNSTISSRGYKQVILTVTPVSGNLLTCNFTPRFVTVPAQTTAYSSGFLDCILSMPNAISGLSIIFSPVNTSFILHRYVEKFDIKTIGNCNSLLLFFFSCSSLQSVPLFNTQNVNNMQGIFESCISLQSVPLFNTQNVTNMSTMFRVCTSLQSVPLFNTQNVNNMANMFQSCVSLQSVPLFNTQNVTSMSEMFNGCLSLKNIPALSTASITTTSGIDFTNFTINCNSLDRCQIIFARNVNLTNCQLSQTALVEIFNNLVNRTSTTSANINITGNWGATALTAADRLIATSKNWTISG